ncbi:MAG: hypothetical protein E7D27_11405 [Clostridium celatum]|nr:hypothetical protein [Clostridium celatum]
MNRHERKRQLAESKKKSQWYKGLMQWQKEYIDEMIYYQRSYAQTEMISNLDTILTGALVEKTDFNLDEILEFNMLVAKYYGEFKNMENKMGSEERIMSLRSIEKEVLNKIDEMIKDGKKKTEIIKCLRETYKGSGATTAEYNAAYKNRLEEYEKEKVAEKILEIIDKHDKVNDEVIEYDFDKENISKNTVISNDRDGVSDGLTFKFTDLRDKKLNEVEEFEIIKEVRIVDLKGKFGTYHVEKGIVQAREKTFANKEDVSSWASKERESLVKQIEELKDKIHIINSKEDETLRVIERFI